MSSIVTTTYVFLICIFFLENPTFLLSLPSFESVLVFDGFLFFRFYFSIKNEEKRKVYKLTIIIYFFFLFFFFCFLSWELFFFVSVSLYLFTTTFTFLYLISWEEKGEKKGKKSNILWVLWFLFVTFSFILKEQEERNGGYVLIITIQILVFFTNMNTEMGIKLEFWKVL